MEDFYPEKPLLEKAPDRKGKMSATVFSMALFVLAFVLFLDNNILLVLGVLGILLFHELGHFFMMKLFRYENVRMLFVPLMGAFVHGRKDKYSMKQQALVILAGPVPGIVLGCLAILGTQLNWWNEIVGTVGFFMLFLNVGNLLPIIPLDGGRLLESVLVNRTSILPIVFTFLSSMALVAVGFFFEMYFIMGIGLLMGFQVRSQYRNYLIRKELEEEEVSCVSTYDELSNLAFHKIKAVVLKNTPGLRMYAEEAEDPNIDQIMAREVNNVLLAPFESELSLLGRIAFILIWVVALIGPIVWLWKPISALFFN